VPTLRGESECSSGDRAGWRLTRSDSASPTSGRWVDGCPMLQLARAGQPGRLGSVRAVQRSRRLHTLRCHARHHHGRQCVFRHHSGAEGSGGGEAGEPRARSRARRTRETALGAQHLLHTPRAVRDDKQPLRADVRARIQLVDSHCSDIGRCGRAGVFRCTAFRQSVARALGDRGRAAARRGGCHCTQPDRGTGAGQHCRHVCPSAYYRAATLHRMPCQITHAARVRRGTQRCGIRHRCRDRRRREPNR